MKVIKLAELLSFKYAADPKDVEDLLRKKIGILWNYPNKVYNILKACAESGVSKPVDDNEKIAVIGYKFCKELMSMIDYLKINQSKLSLGEIREVLLNIVKLVEVNKGLSFSNGRIDKNSVSDKQFQHVSELIFQLIPVSKKHDMKVRNDQFAKARAGLARILSLGIDMLEDIQKLEVMTPESFKHKGVTPVDVSMDLPERFKPERAMVSENDIVDFIRQYGDEYGISSTDDWGLALRNDPMLKEQMTTVINALNRGHMPRNSADVKMQIAELMKEYEERKSNNSHLFEDSEG